ncbi:response regulator [bacterium]|nr:response regulator [bacterium]
MITEQDLHKATILLVDDDPLNVDVLKEILNGDGYENIDATTRPVEAVAMFKDNNYDLVLLDILMPEMDGFAVMAEFSAVKKESQAPILILSALSDHNTRLRALSGGARDYLTKPFNPDEVLLRIRNLLEVKLSQEQLQKHNQILDQKVKERTQEIKSTQLEIVHRLGVAAEYRDNETGLHIIRMSQFSYEIAKAANIDALEAELIFNASPMHDIGKIGIPDSILLKPGKLTPEEWEVMKTHASIGGKILEGHPVPILQTAILIALSHHEKWDGSGYPRGLSGTDIPLSGRVTAVADVFDALTSVRPYKKPWPTDRAISAIEKDAGIHFDPRFVKAFKSCLPAIIEIKDKYIDRFSETPSSIDD